jgi:hypothetical protein
VLSLNSTGLTRIPYGRRLRAGGLGNIEDLLFPITAMAPQRRQSRESICRPMGLESKQGQQSMSHARLAVKHRRRAAVLERNAIRAMLHSQR